MVAVKGTSSPGDVVTDLLLAPHPLPNGGVAHGGVHAASRFVLERAGPILRTLLRDYDVTLVGHSLGAGAAALVAHAMVHDPACAIALRLREAVALRDCVCVAVSRGRA